MTDDTRSGLRLRFKSLRKRLLSKAPFIRRSRHHRLLASVKKDLERERAANESMGFLFFSPPTLATSARFVMRVPVRDRVADELCLFVTHASRTNLKPHVIDHIEALLDAGVAVMLIANTDLEPASLEIPPLLQERLHGLMIRQNIGFDFAAWAHAYAQIDSRSVSQRLFLINDSLVGPLDRVVYDELLQKIRGAQADFIGLTCNPDSHEHLQSFYLVFNSRLLHAAVFDRFMRSVVNLPAKQNVVDCYEIWLTPFLVQQGFVGVAMFPNIATNQRPFRNDTLYNWRELIDAGFPFIKGQVLRDPSMADRARELLPSRYR